MKFLVQMLVILLFCMQAFGNHQNLSHLLINDLFVAMNDEGKPRVFNGGTDEKYYAYDSFGHNFKLRLKNLTPLLAEVGASELIEAIDLPNLRVLPVILQRGVRGLPTSAEAAELAPYGDKFGLAGKNGFPFQATAQALTSELKPYQVNDLNSAQLVELLMNVIINYLVGNNDIQLSTSGDGNIGFNGEHFYTLDITQAFKFYTGSDSFQRFFDLSLIQTHSKYNDMESDFWRSFLSELNVYISKLESLSAEDAKVFFGSYQRASNSFHAFKNLPQVDYINIFLSKVKNLRSSLNQVLTSFNEFERLSDQRIKISSQRLSLKEEIPTYEASLAPSHLLAFFEEDHPGIRGAAMKKWAQERSVETGDILNVYSSDYRKSMQQGLLCKQLLLLNK